MIGALLPALVPILGDALKRLFPDAEARQRAEAELNAALLARAGELEKAAADIIKTEAQSEHWLAACWRPLMMITFGILIVLRWLGWSAPGISEAEALKLWNIVEILSPLAFAIEHRAEIEVLAADNTLLDALLVAIAAAITADPMLGGAVEWAQPGSADIEDVEFEGAASARAASLPVTLFFTATGSPLA
jgi:hypothetical protein